MSSARLAFLGFLGRRARSWRLLALYEESRLGGRR